MMKEKIDMDEVKKLYVEACTDIIWRDGFTYDCVILGDNVFNLNLQGQLFGSLRSLKRQGWHVEHIRDLDDALGAINAWREYMRKKRKEAQQ